MMMMNQPRTKMKAKRMKNPMQQQQLLPWLHAGEELDMEEVRVVRVEGE